MPSEEHLRRLVDLEDDDLIAKAELDKLLRRRNLPGLPEPEPFGPQSFKEYLLEETQAFIEWQVGRFVGYARPVFFNHLTAEVIYPTLGFLAHILNENDSRYRMRPLHPGEIHYSWEMRPGEEWGDWDVLHIVFSLPWMVSPIFQETLYFHACVSIPGSPWAPPTTQGE